MAHSSLLRSVLDRAAALGYGVQSGMEFEWFNFSETAHTLHEKDFVKPEPLTPGSIARRSLRAQQIDHTHRNARVLMHAHGAKCSILPRYHEKLRVRTAAALCVAK